MYFVHLLASYIEHHLLISYAILLLGVILEGEIVLIVLGVFAHTHVIPLHNALLIAITGAIIKTFLGYSIGHFIKKYIPKNMLFDFIEKRVLLVFPHFRERPFWSLFFSKFVYGLNHFTIIFAGYIQARLRTYIIAETISSIAWITILFSIGFFFSYTAFGLSHDIRKVALVLLLCIIGFLIVSRIMNFIIELIESEE